MNNSAIIAANFKTLHLDSRPVSRGKEENSCFVAENRREKGGGDDQEEEEEEQKRNIDDSPFSWVDSMANMFKASN